MSTRSPYDYSAYTEKVVEWNTILVNSMTKTLRRAIAENRGLTQAEKQDIAFWRSQLI